MSGGKKNFGDNYTCQICVFLVGNSIIVFESDESHCLKNEIAVKKRKDKEKKKRKKSD